MSIGSSFKLARRDIDEPFENIRRVGFADAAQRAMSGLVGGNADSIHRIILDLIDAGHVERGGLNRMIHGISRAHIGDDLVVDTQDRAIFFERHFDVVNLIAPMAAIAHMLDPCLAPLDRPTELA